MGVTYTKIQGSLTYNKLEFYNDKVSMSDLYTIYRICEHYSLKHVRTDTFMKQIKPFITKYEDQNIVYLQRTDKCFKGELKYDGKYGQTPVSADRSVMKLFLREDAKRFCQSIDIGKLKSEYMKL